MTNFDRQLLPGFAALTGIARAAQTARGGLLNPPATLHTHPTFTQGEIP